MPANEPLSSDQWHVAPGDPTCVFAPGVAKPINCHGKERAAAVAAAMNAQSKASANSTALSSKNLVSELRDPSLSALSAKVLCPQAAVEIDRLQGIVSHQDAFIVEKVQPFVSYILKQTCDRWHCQEIRELAKGLGLPEEALRG